MEEGVDLAGKLVFGFPSYFINNKKKAAINRFGNEKQVNIFAVKNEVFQFCAGIYADKLELKIISLLSFCLTKIYQE